MKNIYMLIVVALMASCGERGEPGPPGINGVNGKDGTNGTNGTNGVDQVITSNGNVVVVNGTNGTNGESAEQINEDMYNNILPYQNSVLNVFCTGNKVLFGSGVLVNGSVITTLHIVSDYGANDISGCSFYYGKTLIGQYGSNYSSNYDNTDYATISGPNGLYDIAIISLQGRFNPHGGEGSAPYISNYQPKIGEQLTMVIPENLAAPNPGNRFAFGTVVATNVNQQTMFQATQEAYWYNAFAGNFVYQFSQDYSDGSPVFNKDGNLVGIYAGNGGPDSFNYVLPIPF